jgi:Putative restriction endonuclease
MTPTTTSTIPPLVDGDRLSRKEFHRRYLEMPHVKIADLIEGIVYIGPRIPAKRGEARAHLAGWLGFYSFQTAGLTGAINGTVRLEGDNEVQPTCVVRIEHSSGGSSLIDADDYLEGGPELVGEVTLTNSNVECHAKKRVYLANWVREYIIWRIEDEAIDWFVLRDGRYESLVADEGIHKSVVFPGLWLDMGAMLRRDLAGVFAVLQQGMATPEHAAFVARLASTRLP